VIGLGAIGGITAQRLIRRRARRRPRRRTSAAAVAPKFPKARVSATLSDGQYDLILLCVRSTETERALTSAAPLLKPDGAVVSCRTASRKSAPRGWSALARPGAVIGWSASMVEPESIC